MKLLYHIYEHKSGRKFLLRCVPESENIKSIIWYGFEIIEHHEGLMYKDAKILDLIYEGKFWKGSLKKDVLKQIQNEIK